MEDTDDSQLHDLLTHLARTPDVSNALRSLRPGTVLARRFELGRQLGQGGMGRVFAAYDRRREERVALKLLGSVTPQAIVQLKHEFRIAAELHHVNLVRLHELFSDGVEWFFTMELIDGETLEGFAGNVEPVLQQLAEAIRELHRGGMLHGDLKPTNMLLTPQGRLVLLDFGLARPVGADTRLFRRAGTRGYMSPEQAAGQVLTAASDWFSFGVVVHELLTGQLPTETVWPELSARTALQNLCVELLQPEAAQRPSEAEIMRVLGAAPSSAPARGPRGELGLVGRSAELAQLRAALGQAIEQRTPVVALVRGPSGIGKSTLVEHFIAEARADGATVLSGRCRERESVGHKAVDTLIDGLVTFLDDLPSSDASVLVPRGIEDLTRLFPALRAAAVFAHAPRTQPQTSDDVLARLRAITAFSELLRPIAARTPLILWIDDLQWSDAESAAVLAPLLTASFAAPVLLIGSLRTHNEACAPLLEALDRIHDKVLPRPIEIGLDTLSTEDCVTLALLLLPIAERDARPIANAIAQDAHGNPLFVSELAQAIDAADGTRPRAATLAELIRQRVAALPRDARGVLEVMALAGAPLTRRVARIATGLSAERAESGLDNLSAHRLVRSNGMQADSNLDLLHDRIREIIVMDIPEPARKSLHFALARALESQPDARPDLVATHFEAAGALAEAGVHWITAGDSAATKLAFTRAAQLYALGEQHAPLDAEHRHEIRMRRAHMLSSAGRGVDAAELYLEAAEQRADKVHLERLAAEQLLLAGHLERGLKVIDRVLRTLGMRATRGGRSVLLSIALGRAQLRARGLRYTERSEADLTSRQLACIDAAWTGAMSLGTMDPLRGADLQTAHLLLALRAGEPHRLLRALTLEVSYTAAAGLRDQTRAQRLFELVDRLAQRAGDPTAQGLVHLVRGLADYLLGHVASACEHLSEGERIFSSQCSGAVWETATTNRFLVASWFFLGRFAQLAERVPPLLAQATAQGHLYSQMAFRTHFASVAWLVKDDLVEVRRQLDQAHADWTEPSYKLPAHSLLVSEIYCELYTGNYQSAWSKLERQWPNLLDSGLLRIGVVGLHMWYMRSACAQGAAQAAAEQGDKRAALQLFSEARSAARQLSKQSTALAPPMARLLFANAAALEGHGSVRDLEACIAELESHQLKLYAAAAKERLAALLGPERGPIVSNQARAAFKEEGVVRPRHMMRVLLPGVSNFI